MATPETSEKIMEKAFAGLEWFLQRHLDAESFQHFILEKQRLFPTWNHLWQHFERWLRQYILSDMQSTILDLTKWLPLNDSVNRNLQNSLVIHEDFWNQVYENLIKAKLRLPC